MNALTLYSGAGGLDIGLKKAGFQVKWANDFNKNACETYKHNLGDHIVHGDIYDYMDEIRGFKGSIDLVAGGPPCQGFSVAGKMNPDDPRSKHVWTFTDIVEMLSPKAFIMENVKALGTLEKWKPLRDALLKKFRSMGYSTSFVVLNASEFNTPQARFRVFFIGFKGNGKIIPDLEKMLLPYKKYGQTVREALSVLDRAGTGNNSNICKAKITIAPNPVLRRSPFAGMLFNGLGRPVKLDGYCSTLPASMGGNKTPIIDEMELYENEEGWVQNYHSNILNGGKPMDFQEAPARLRRLTPKEAAIIQTFPFEYEFKGSQSSQYSQIGNAVPCNLGYAVSKMVMDCLINQEADQLDLPHLEYQLEIEA